MKAILINKESFTDRDVLYTFELEKEERIIPGQFVEIEVNHKTVPFLRRAISVFDAEGKTLKLYIRTVGDGTKEINTWPVGHETDILLPLGNGFTWQEGPGQVLLAGGGIGIAPMYYLAKTFIEEGKQVNLLFLPERDKGMLDAFQGISEKITILIAKNRNELPQVLENALKDGKGDNGIFVCGPVPMMKKIAEMAVEKGLDSQVSMEGCMGCGYGICAGCVIPIKTDTGFTYKKACIEGPVFTGSEVIFDE